MAHLQPVALLTTGLLTRALARLDDAVHRQHDPATLRRVLLLARQTGALDRAADAAAALAAVDPQDGEAAYLAAMLAGEPAERTEPSWPANFIRIPNYLPRERYDLLVTRLATAAKAMSESVVARGGTHLVAPETRRSTGTAALDPLAEELGQGILARAHEWCARLGIPAFDAEVRALKLTRYRSGDYFRRHRDDPTGSTRPLGFIYYLRFPDQTFDGGQLMLYDGQHDPGHGTAGWTAVLPEANSLVVLPSWHWHEVAPIRSASTDTLSGRFTLNGWLFRAAGGG